VVSVLPYGVVWVQHRPGNADPHAIISLFKLGSVRLLRFMPPQWGNNPFGRASERAMSAMAVTRNLPAQPTVLIGRDAEIDGAARRLRRPEVRLLTMLGPGGVGKTRLAIALVEHVAADYRDGVAFIDLTRVQEPSELLTAIAETLGLRDSQVAAATEQLQRFVEDRQMLLLLDNFEHLLDATLDVSKLLSASDRLTLLVTSREPLHLRWEHQFAVRPLGLPRLNQELSPEDAGQVASMALFVERAQAAQPTFQITQANAPLPTPSAPGVQTLAVPSYVPPGSAWSQLEVAAPTVGLTIINPNSGPGHLQLWLCQSSAAGPRGRVDRAGVCPYFKRRTLERSRENRNRSVLRLVRHRRDLLR